MTNLPRPEAPIPSSPCTRRFSRSELDALPRRLLHRGGPTKADLWIVDLEARTAVVKDFAAKKWWVRAIGALQIARECRAYRRATGVAGVARFLGPVDRLAFVLDHVEGQALTASPKRPEGRGVHYAPLRRIIEDLHAAGIAHLDLGGRDNVMLAADGTLRVLDLASAVYLRPGGVAHRAVFRFLKRADDAALLKFKRLLSAGPYTAEEEAFLRRHRFWRTLWFFNRKSAARSPAGRR